MPFTALMFILIVLALLLILLRMQNVFTWAFGAGIISIVMSMIVLHVYMGRYAGVPPEWATVFQTRSGPVLALLGRLSPFSLDYVFNAVQLVFFGAITTMAVRSRRVLAGHPWPDARRRWWIAPVAVGLAGPAFFLAFSPDLLYELLVSRGSVAHTVRDHIEAVQTVVKSGLLILLFAPLPLLVTIGRRSTLLPVKRAVRVLEADLVVLNGLYGALVLFGPFNVSRINTVSRVLIADERALYFLTPRDFLVLFLCLILIVGLLVASSKLRYLGNLNLVRVPSWIRRERHSVPTLEMRSVFHYFKNTFFTLTLLLNETNPGNMNAAVADTGVAGPRDLGARSAGVQDADGANVPSSHGGTGLHGGVVASDLAPISEAERRRRHRALTICREALVHVDRLMRYSGRRSLNLQTVTMRELIAGSLDKTVVEAGYTVRVDCAPDLRVTGDPTVLDEVLHNLVTNAAESLSEARPTDPLITVRAYREFGWTVLQVEDNGTGLEKRDMRRIMRPFYTSKNTKVNWGIGLSFCHRVMHQHGGVIYAEGRPGAFARFTLLFPQRRRAHG